MVIFLTCAGGASMMKGGGRGKGRPRKTVGMEILSKSTHVPLEGDDAEC